VLGRNGAGKSTLLRLLAGVSQPTEGEVVLRGRAAPLLSVGVGFHPEMTGKENVYVNGMLLGLSRAEIDDRFDDIVAFSELADFIHTPVKFYSSGMFMRLGFSVAVHTDPDILLVDEVLAVGDIAFQLKCFDRMRRLQSAGTTILFVSHSVHAIHLLCPRALVFRHGRLEFDGPASEAIGVHHDLLAHEQQDHVPLHERSARDTVRVEHVSLQGESGASGMLQNGELARLHVQLEFLDDTESPQALFMVRSEDRTLVYRFQSTFGTDGRTYAAGAKADLVVEFTARAGGGGTFTAEVSVTDKAGRNVLGKSGAATAFYVPPRLGNLGVADLEASLLLDGVDIGQHRPLLLGGGSDG
ncbi:MAG: ABC transporter ATP-binding protein, partial [Acidimicrobiales bacterium]